MVREEDFVDDPAHPRPLMALIQSGLCGVLQHLDGGDREEELEDEDAKMEGDTQCSG